MLSRYSGWVGLVFKAMAFYQEARFGTVSTTLFRCVRMKVVNSRYLWCLTRQMFQLPIMRHTVDFDAIRFGDDVNDGDHNPHGMSTDQPEVDWGSREVMGDWLRSKNE